MVSYKIYGSHSTYHGHEAKKLEIKQSTKEISIFKRKKIENKKINTLLFTDLHLFKFYNLHIIEFIFIL